MSAGKKKQNSRSSLPKTDVRWMNPDELDEIFVSQALKPQIQASDEDDSTRTHESTSAESTNNNRAQPTPQHSSGKDFSTECPFARKRRRKSTEDVTVLISIKKEQIETETDANHDVPDLDTELNCTGEGEGSECADEGIKDRERGYIVHVCEICGKTFGQKGGLDAHLRVHTGERPYKCLECGKGFKQMSGLSYHVKTHQKEGNKCYFCEECGNGYSSKHALDTHRNKHINHKHYACELCERRYNDPNSLRRHMKYHTGPDVACLEPTCARMFTSKSEMMTHMHTHTGIKPFKCTVCEKTFTTKAKLQSHGMLHEGLRPFECPVCCRAFAQKSNMLNHVNRVHEITSDSVVVEKLENGECKSSLLEIVEPNPVESRGRSLGKNAKKDSEKNQSRKCEAEVQVVKMSLLCNESCDDKDNELQVSHTRNVNMLDEENCKQASRDLHEPLKGSSNHKKMEFELAHEIPIGCRGDVIQALRVCSKKKLIEPIAPDEETSGAICDGIMTEGKENEDVTAGGNSSADETDGQQQLIYMEEEVAQNVEVDCPDA